ncbi:MAG: tetratricopeptide repeat protein [Bacteroidetes bacterium]|nr:tetratricopeptide repeat protein [Bacteroidota bacterium]
MYIEITEVSDLKDVDSIIKYCEMAVALDEKKLSLGIGKEERRIHLSNLAAALNNLGFMQFYSEEKANAFPFYKKAIIIQEHINDSIALGISYLNIAHLYLECFDTINAFSSFESAVKKTKLSKNRTVYFESLYNLASLHLAKQNLLEAEKYCDEIIANSSGPEQNSSVYTAISTLASINCIKGDTLKAIDLYKKSLEFSIKENDKTFTAGTYNDLGGIYRNQNNFVESEFYFKKGLKILDSLGEDGSLAIVLRNYSKLFLRQKNLKKAESLALQSMNHAKESGSFKEIKYSAEILCQIYNSQKSNKAIEYCSLAKAMEDSVNKISKENKLFLDDFKKTYDSFDSDFIKKYDEIKPEAEEKSNLTLYIIGISVLILLVGFYFYYKSKKG